MAIIKNLSSGAVRSTKRILPGLFTPDRNRNIRRYRLIGDEHEFREHFICDPTLCGGQINCSDGEGCWFSVGCDVITGIMLSAINCIPPNVGYIIIERSFTIFESLTTYSEWHTIAEYCSSIFYNISVAPCPELGTITYERYCTASNTWPITSCGDWSVLYNDCSSVIYETSTVPCLELGTLTYERYCTASNTLPITSCDGWSLIYNGCSSVIYQTSTVDCLELGTMTYERYCTASNTLPITSCGDWTLLYNGCSSVTQLFSTTNCLPPYTTGQHTYTRYCTSSNVWPITTCTDWIYLSGNCGGIPTCENDLPADGSFHEVNNPQIIPMELGAGTGTVFLRGKNRGAADRFILGMDDYNGNRVVVLDTRYRGALSSEDQSTNYFAVLYNKYTSLLSYPPAQATYEATIIPATAYGASYASTISWGKYGDFVDLTFVKSLTTNMLYISAYGPLTSGTQWYLTVTCPRNPLFYYSFTPNIYTKSATASAVSATCNPNIYASQFLKREGIVIPGITIDTPQDAYRAWLTREYTINTTLHQGIILNECFDFNATTLNSATAVISGVWGPMMGKTNTGPLSVALVYNTNNNWSSYNTVANFEMVPGNNLITDYSNVINRQLSAQHITLYPNVTTYFKLVPYANTNLTSGRFNLYDWEHFGFYGRVTTP